jgi:hypothetical protein
VMSQPFVFRIFFFRKIRIKNGNFQYFSLVKGNIRGPFGKFVDSSYYSESALRGGAVTVSFSKYLPWQATHFLQCSTHFSKTCCRPFAASVRRIAVLTFHFRFSVSKALLPLENLSSSHSILPIGLMDEL